MNRIESAFVVSVILAGILVGIAFQDSLTAVFINVAIILFGLVPIVLTLGVIAIIQKLFRGHLTAPIRHSLLAGLAAVLSLVLAVETGGRINRWEISAVEQYVLRAVPVLDRIKAQTGSYPSTVRSNLIGEPPLLLRAYGSYTATSKSFSFEYIDEPAGWAGGEGPLKFESSKRQWIVDR